jgi:hypothetical protein
VHEGGEMELAHQSPGLTHGVEGSPAGLQDKALLHHLRTLQGDVSPLGTPLSPVSPW